MLEAHVIRFKCVLKNPRRTKFPEPSTMASDNRIMVCGHKTPRIIIISLVSKWEMINCKNL